MREAIRELLQGNYLVFAVLGYLSGSILFSYYIPKHWKHIDVTAGSKDGNPGAFNAFAQAGVWTGLICLLCDLAKGYLAIFFAVPFLELRNPLFALVLMAPVCGHAFSLLRHFSGGKAIAVSFGVLLGMVPVEWHVMILAIVYILLLFCRHVQPNERKSVCAFGILNIYALLHMMRNQVMGIGLGVIGVTWIVIWKNWKEALTPKNRNEEQYGRTV